MKSKETWALVTGASGGIGAEIARELASKGVHLVLAARSEDKLTELGKHLEHSFSIQCRIQRTDLAQTGAPLELFQQVSDCPISILVNNAGFGYFGGFQTSDWSHYQNMIQVNMASLSHLTYLFLPKFKELNKPAYILNVGSVAGWQGVPNFAFYAATKAFVNAFSEGLAWELEGSNVSLTCLQPGKTATGFFDASKVEEGHQEFTESGTMSAKEVAKQGVSAMFNKENSTITGVMNKLNVLSSRLAPRWVLKKTVSHIFREFSE